MNRYFRHDFEIYHYAHVMMLLKDALSIERTDINPILLHCVQSVIDEQSTVNRPCKRKDIWKQAKCECRCSRMSYLINVMSFESAEDYQ